MPTQPAAAVQSRRIVKVSRRVRARSTRSAAEADIHRDAAVCINMQAG